MSKISEVGKLSEKEALGILILKYPGEIAIFLPTYHPFIIYLAEKKRWYDFALYMQYHQNVKFLYKRAKWNDEISTFLEYLCSFGDNDEETNELLQFLCEKFTFSNVYSERCGASLLLRSAHSSIKLKILWNYFPEKERKSSDNVGRGILIYARHNIESLKFLFEHLDNLPQEIYRITIHDDCFLFDIESHREICDLFLTTISKNPKLCVECKNIHQKLSKMYSNCLPQWQFIEDKLLTLEQEAIAILAKSNFSFGRKLFLILNTSHRAPPS